MSRKAISRNILEGERFEGAAAIAGQLAHEFRNLVMPLMAYPPMVRDELAPNAPARRLLDQMEKTARDMAHIVEQLSVLSSGADEKMILDVNASVRTAAEGLRAEGCLHGVAVALDLSSEPVKLRGAPERIERAVGDLIRNGIEAAGESGRVTVQTAVVSVEAGRTACGMDVTPGRYVRISVKDGGPGIAAEVWPRLFEPLLTTKKKAARRGAGLGLCIAYRVAREHGGHIDAVSAPGAGTTFSLFLAAEPARPQHGEAKAEGVADASSASDGDERTRPASRILIVDDDAQILRLFGAILAQELPGYPIDMATNGAEALESFQRNPARVLLMDLHMPIMDGQSAFMEIESLCRDRQWPMPAVVFCTGFAPPDAVRRLLSGGGPHGLLSKPVRGRVLVEAVRSRL